MPEPLTTSEPLKVLRGALERLLAEPGGKDVDGGPFRGVVWGFLDAFCQVPGAEKLLEEYGDFVQVNTAPGTPYAKAWKRGHRHVVEGFPLGLQESGPQKEYASALDHERDALDSVLYGSDGLTDEAAQKLQEHIASLKEAQEGLEKVLYSGNGLTDEAEKALREHIASLKEEQEAREKVLYSGDGLTDETEKALREHIASLKEEQEAIEKVLYSGDGLTDEAAQKLQESIASLKEEQEAMEIDRHGRRHLTDEAERDLEAWWHIARDLASRAKNYHADGCSHLLQMRRHGLDTFSTYLAPEFHKDIKAASEFLVGQLEAMPVATAKNPRRRKRKSDPKVAEQRAKAKERRKREKEIFDEWKKGQWDTYDDYVTWQNEYLPEGWEKLSKRDVARAIENHKGRLKRGGKWPPDESRR